MKFAFDLPPWLKMSTVILPCSVRRGSQEGHQHAAFHVGPTISYRTALKDSTPEFGSAEIYCPTITSPIRQHYTSGRFKSGDCLRLFRFYIEVNDSAACSRDNVWESQAFTLVREKMDATRDRILLQPLFLDLHHSLTVGSFTCFAFTRNYLAATDTDVCYSPNLGVQYGSDVSGCFLCSPPCYVWVVRHGTSNASKLGLLNLTKVLA